MTQTRSSFSVAITRMFSLLGRKIEPDIVNEWAGYLEKQGITADQLGKAIHDTLQKPVDPYKLTVSHLIEKVRGPQQSAHSIACDTASRIMDATYRHKALFGTIGTAEKVERIKADIGEIGWACVEQLGGWNAVVDSTDNAENHGTLKAQWRDLALALQDKIRCGLSLELPSPAPQQPETLNAFQQKLIEVANGRKN